MPDAYFIRQHLLSRNFARDYQKGQGADDRLEDDGLAPRSVMPGGIGTAGFWEAAF